MKTITLLLLLFAAVSASKAPEYTTEDSVLILNSDSFGTALDAFRTLVVLFHETNPKSSGLLSKESLNSEFLAAADVAAEEFPGIRFAKMDGEKFNKYAQMYGATQLPSIRYLTTVKTDTEEYKGSKTTDEIMDWVREKLQSKVPEIDTLKELMFALQNNKHVGLYFGPSSTKAFKAFVGATTLFKDVYFAWSNAKELKSEHSVEDGTFVMYRNHTTESKDIDTFNIKSLQHFIETYKYPALMTFNGDAIKRIFNEKNNGMFLLGTTETMEGPELQAFAEISDLFRGKIAFAAGLFSSPYGAKIAEYLGIGAQDLPAVVILDAERGMRKYRFDQDIEFRNLGIFFLNFYYDNLRPYYKSAPVPEVNYDGDVKIVVSSNFKTEILESDYDVMVEFYSPTCGRCQAFAPIYSAAASKLKKSNPEIVVAKIDAMANEVEGIDLEGFPSVLFFEKGKSTYRTYKGDLGEKSVIEFARAKGDIEM